MTIVLQLIQAAGKAATVLVDAFMLVGSLADGKSVHSQDVFLANAMHQP